MNSPDQDQPRRDAESGKVALSWAVRHGQADLLVNQISRRMRRRRRGALSAVMFAILLAGTVTWNVWPPAGSTPSLRVARLVNVVDGPSRKILGDGTNIEFMPGTEFSVEYTAGARHVTMLKGSAHFQVTKNPSRPFIVAAGGVNVQAVGTGFSIDLNLASVGVVVTEGTVAVASSLQSGPAAELPVLMVAGKRMVLSRTQVESTHVMTLSPEELQRLMEWRVPRLEFNATPLSDAIPLFNEHALVHMILAPELGSLTMSGVLRADNTAALLRLLKDEFSITAEDRGDGVLYLHR